MNGQTVVFERQSCIPKLFEELRKVVDGKIAQNNAYKKEDPCDEETIDGEKAYKLVWDPEYINADKDNWRWPKIEKEFPWAAEWLNHESRYFIAYKTVRVSFFADGSIRFRGEIDKTITLTYQQWKNNVNIEESSLEKVFKSPGIDLVPVEIPKSPGAFDTSSFHDPDEPHGGM
ncbi:MAG: hypothetical protein Q8P60_05640 [Pseudorhodobacter sp.]|nr:hypothetical protein [Pseudorhodobacter sp.]